MLIWIARDKGYYYNFAYIYSSKPILDNNGIYNASNQNDSVICVDDNQFDNFGVKVGECKCFELTEVKE
jgi:hypothetical protein